MKTFLMLLLIPLCAHAQRFGGFPSRQPNTFAPVPMQVMYEGRMESGLALSTQIQNNNVSNLFAAGFINGTWAVVTNNNTTNAIPTLRIGASTSIETQHGFYVPGTTTPFDLGTRNLLWDMSGRGDIFPRWTWTAGFQPTVFVMGFEMSISNFNGTFQAYDGPRIGQDPYCICQLGDETEVSGAQTLLVHSPDGGQIGRPVVIVDNGASKTYEVVMMYDGFNTNVGCQMFVLEKLVNGGFLFKGESIIGMNTNGSGGLPRIKAANVWIGPNDDHGSNLGTAGQWRIKNVWGTTNREVYEARLRPYF